MCFIPSNGYLYVTMCISGAYLTGEIFHPIFAAEKKQRHFLKLLFNIKILQA